MENNIGNPYQNRYYADWNIIVEVINDGPCSYFYKKGSRATLLKIDTLTVPRNGSYVREEQAYVQYNDQFRLREWIPIRDILPVLRPYSALCKPLPDGTIPSIEIAKLITDDTLFKSASYISKVIKNGLSIENSIGIYLPSVDGVSIICYYDWWDLYEKEEDIIPYRIYDYLYSEHFAVNLKSHQFIELV